jgi:iron complex outermembrane receptor protein
VNVVDPDQGNALVSTAGVFSGNPNLKAERSNNYTLGMVFEPTRDFNIGFDAYKINQKNVVNAPSFQYIVDNPDQFPGQIHRDPVTGALIYISSAYQNLSFVDTSGVDITVNKTFNLGAWGKAGIAANFNYLAHYWTQVAADAPVEDYVDQDGYVELPRYSGSIVFDWSKGPWTSALTWHYAAGYDNVGANSDVLPRIGSYQTWDLFGSYQWNKNLKITGSIRNLADKMPPYDPNYATTHITYNYDLRGRYVNLGASYTFK